MSKNKKKKLNGYMLELIPAEKAEHLAEDIELIDRNISFQNELQKILVLFVKENSLYVLINEILNRCVNISGSTFGIVVTHKNKSNFNYSLSKF